jgi:hypothetical protein
VEEVLAQSSAAGEVLLQTFRHVKKDRAAYRKALMNRGVLLHESSLGYPPIPTTCATDGSYAIERLLTADLVAAAAVAVEGLTPPSEKRHWQQPHHSTLVVPEVHRAETATVLRAVMLGKELLLAAEAPHDLIMIDGSLAVPLIHLNQAIGQAPGLPELRSSEVFVAECCHYLRAYLSITQSKRSDKNFIALPKYSTRREIGRDMGWPGEHDDRGLLTLLLQPGELTRPRELEQPEQEWHLYATHLPDQARRVVDELAKEIIPSLQRVQVLYYKPHDWLPALRVEVAHDIATNTHRLATVIQGLKHQCATPSMLEPYPLYLADRTVKALARALPAFRHITTQRMADQYEGNIGEVFFAMHGYRSESGR